MQSYDDRLTFLLPRPTWVNDMDVSFCYLCNTAFGPLRRRHHCRNCGNIFCQECSSRKVPLPQLGYGTKAVRVCNGCFDVAYLVTYIIDQDHGVSTQIHGVRGLLELAEKDNDKDLHNMVAYGGIDALVWVCRTSKNLTLHHLTTTVLAILAEKESIRPAIIIKWALPPLLSLIQLYASINHLKETSSDHSSAPSISSLSEDNAQNFALEILINCTHVLYQLSKAGILSQKEVIDEGVLEILLVLAAFDISLLKLATSGKQDGQTTDRINIIQSLAAKAISAISSQVSFQSSIIEVVQASGKLPCLLRSSNNEVRKYLAKAVAYLSLRNDKYKSSLLGGEGSRALISIIARLPLDDLDRKTKSEDLLYYLATDTSDDADHPTTESSVDVAAISHACCALANFATNNESQLNLMLQPRLLRYICNVPAALPMHVEIHKHVARCLANLALYKENCSIMLGCNISKSSSHTQAYNILPTLLALGQSPHATVDITRHVVRAIDNISSNVQLLSDDEIELMQWKGKCQEIYPFITGILNTNAEQDNDTIKRAKSIIQKKIFEPTEKASITSSELTDTDISDDKENSSIKVSDCITKNERHDNSSEHSTKSSKSKSKSKRRN